MAAYQQQQLAKGCAHNTAWPLCIAVHYTTAGTLPASVMTAACMLSVAVVRLYGIL